MAQVQVPHDSNEAASLLIDAVAPDTAAADTTSTAPGFTAAAPASKIMLGLKRYLQVGCWDPDHSLKSLQLMGHI